VIRKLILAAAMFAMATTAANAHALSLTFNEFAHGGVVSTPNNANYLGVIINVTNLSGLPGHPDLGVAFDSENEVGTADPDLERGNGWATGNLAPSTVLDNLLIIQENDLGCNTDICSVPDDEFSNPAGTIELDFRQLKERHSTFQFDLVDIEDTTIEAGMIEFFLNGGLVQTFDFADFGPDYGAIWGDNSANRVDLGLVGEFDQILITMGGSGGITNIITTIPEPSTLALSGLGLIGIALVGRRRR
jgi:hypothetical protein